MLHSGKKFHSFNYREYFIRRTKEEFRKNKAITDEPQILKLIQKAKENDAILRRQSYINALYATDDIVLNTKRE
jgi:hypothetical protein